MTRFFDMGSVKLLLNQQKQAVFTTCFGFLAQLGERRPYKADVVGSNPTEAIYLL